MLVAMICKCFHQQGILILQKLETLLTNKNWLTDTVAQDGADFNQDRLKAQLSMLHITDTEGSMQDLQSIIRYLRGLNGVVIMVATLILVMPATNALSERSFSALRRIKSWLRTTSSPQQLHDSSRTQNQN